MRRHLHAFVATAAVALAGCRTTPSARLHLSDPDYWPTAGWRTSTPEAQGFDSATLADVLTTIRQRSIPIHSLQIVRNGYLILDADFYPYDGRALHDTASVTKSVTSTLVGLAVGKGLIASVKAPLLPLFADLSVSNRNARKEAITLEDLLTMRPGLKCEERGEATQSEMRRHPDWVQFMLDQPMAGAPGETFVYCSPGMHLLSAALTRAARSPAFDVARRELFAPLGIVDSVWPADPQGNSFGWGDLHLHPRDMAKLGLLYLHDGRWEGRQLLPAGWAEAATTVHASPLFRNAYGYGWWVFTGARAGQYEAVGRGGQRITVMPAQNLVVVMTGGGFEPGDVGDLLGKALRPNTAMPENPAGVAKLRSSLMTITMPPAPRNVSAAPPLAGRADGVRYEFDANDFGLRTAALMFPSAAEGLFAATFADGRSERHPIGMDGVPRVSGGGRFDMPVALSGEWTSPDTFTLNYDEAGNINFFRMKWTFSGGPDRVKIDVTERSDGSTFTLVGKR